MDSAAWAQQSHLLLSINGTLYISHILLLLAIYYRLHGKAVPSRILDWSAGRITRHCENSKVVTLASGGLTALILFLPLALVSLAMRLATHAVHAQYTGAEPSWWEWTGHKLSSWLWMAMVAVIVGGYYAGLEYARRHAPPDNRLTRLFLKVIPFGDEILRARRRVAGFAPYRPWYHLVVLSTALIVMQLLMSTNPLAEEGRLEPMPESPMKQAVLAVVERAGAGQVELRIKHLPEVTREMNAWGTHNSFGALIAFSQTYWERASKTAVTQTTGHELFHVLHADSGALRATLYWLLAVCTCLLLGFPPARGGVRRNPLARLPVYVMIFVAAWLPCQAVRYAIHRQHEAYADIYGVQLTVGNGFITLEEAKESLIRSSAYNFNDPDPAWLFKVLFMDHPPLVERLKNMDEAVRQMGVAPEPTTEAARR